MKGKFAYAALSAAAITLSASGMISFAAGGQQVAAKLITNEGKAEIEVDKKNPLGTELRGLYSIELDLQDGSKRTIYQYVPASVGYRQPEVAIGIPSDTAADVFMEQSGWKQVADDNGICLILLPAAEGGWKSVAAEADFMNKAFDYMNDRTYLQTQDAAFYMVGYEDAADSVMAYAVENSEMFAGFGAFGVDDFDTALLAKAKTESSNAKGIMKSEVAVPMWIGADNITPAVTELTQYWTAANKCGGDITANQYANLIYQPAAYMAKTNEITYADCSKVLVSVGVERTENADFTSYLYNEFLKRTRRQDSGDINALRPFASNSEKGMIHQTLTVEGTTREFDVYVPSAVKSGRYTNVPLVFAFHGGGGSGEEFAARSGWDKVAEERNFIVVFPTGSRSNTKFKASTTWGMGDLPFIGEMRSFMISNYSVDTTRIYVSGQSMGCIMSSMVALTHPEWIAACAATSARQMPSETENVNTSLVMPYMWSVGEKDQHFVEGGKDYGLIPACIGEWRARYGITADESNTYTYQNGNFHGYDFKNSQGITLVREQLVTDKIHAMLPDEVYTLYDFLSSYSRGADGTSYYMGVKINQ